MFRKCDYPWGTDRAPVCCVGHNIVTECRLEKFKVPDDRMSEILPYLDYRMHKGAAHHIDNEIRTCLTGRSNVREEVLDEAYAAMYDHIRYFWSVSYDPLPYDVVVSSKDPKASPGFPLRNICTTFEEVCKLFKLENIVDDLYDWESRILQGCEVVLPTIQVFSKRDRYSSAKLASARYRTIQCTDIGLLCLMRKYFSIPIRDLEMMVPWMFLITNAQQYDIKVSRLRKGYNVGVDYTAYDRCQSQQMVAKTLRMLGEILCVPERILDFIVNSVSSSCCMTPSNSLFQMSGLNPSGHYLTSVVNTINHMIINLCFFKDVAGISCRSLLRAQMYGQPSVGYLGVMTGDDGIDNMSCELMALFRSHYEDYVRFNFGIITKIDYRVLLDGTLDVYRDMLPPYLSAVECKVSTTDDLYVSVPCRPNRLLSTLQWTSPHDYDNPNALDDRAEQIKGILENFTAYFDVGTKDWLVRPLQVTALEKLALRFNIVVVDAKSAVLSDGCLVSSAKQHSLAREQKKTAMVKVEVIDAPTAGRKTSRRRKKNKPSQQQASVPKKDMQLVVTTQTKSRKSKKAGRVGKPTSRSSHPFLKIAENAEAKSVLMQMILPHEAMPVRVRGSDSGCILETTLGKSFKVVTVDTTNVRNAVIAKWPTLPGGVPVWDLAEGYDVVSFYDAYVLGAMPVVNPTPSSYGGVNMINPSFDPQSGMLTIASAGSANCVVDKFVLEYVEVAPLGSQLPYGNYHPFMTTSAGRCIWIDATVGSEAIVTLSLTTDANTTIPNNSLGFQLYPIDFGRDSIINTAPRYVKTVGTAAPLQTGDATINVADSGFYYLALNGIVTLGNTSLPARFQPSLRVQTFTSVVTKFIVNEDLHINAWSRGLSNIPLPRDVQVLGSSCLVSNVAPMLYRDGSVFATSWDSVSSFWAMSSRTTETLTGTNPRAVFIGDWPKGCYGYVKPTTLTFRTVTERSSSGVYYNVANIADPLGDTDNKLLGLNHFRIASDSVVGAPGQKARLCFCVAYEYTTSSQLFATGPARIPPSVVDDALFALSTLDLNFSSNDAHESSFLRAIKSAANWLLGAAQTVAPYARFAGRVLELFAPTRTLGTVISGVGQVMSGDFINNLV